MDDGRVTASLVDGECVFLIGPVGYFDIFFFLLVPVIGRKFRKWRLPSAEYHAPTERNVRLPCNELAFLSVRKDLRSFPIHRAAHELIGGCCRALTNAKCQQAQVAANKYYSTRPTPHPTHQLVQRLLLPLNVQKGGDAAGDQQVVKPLGEEGGPC